MGLILRQKSPQALPTFLAMAYILGVNPVVLSDGGMPATAVSSAVACFILIMKEYPDLFKVGDEFQIGCTFVFRYFLGFILLNI